MDRREIIIPVRSQTNGRSWCSCVVSITRAADFSPFKSLPADNSAPFFPTFLPPFYRHPSFLTSQRFFQLFFIFNETKKKVKLTNQLLDIRNSSSLVRLDKNRNTWIEILCKVSLCKELKKSYVSKIYVRMEIYFFICNKENTLFCLNFKKFYSSTKCLENLIVRKKSDVSRSRRGDRCFHRVLWVVARPRTRAILYKLSTR